MLEPCLPNAVLLGGEAILVELLVGSEAIVVVLLREEAIVVELLVGGEAIFVVLLGNEAIVKKLEGEAIEV